MSLSSRAARRCSPSGLPIRRHQGDLPVQPVRLLGRGGDVAVGHQTVKDLEGKDIAAAKGTTNYVMFEWFARQSAPIRRSSRWSTRQRRVRRLRDGRPRHCHSALGASLHHVDTRKPDIRTSICISPIAGRSSPQHQHSYLGVAAHVDWVKKIPPGCPSCTLPTRTPPSGSRPIPMRQQADCAKGTDEQRQAIATLIRANIGSV